MSDYHPFYANTTPHLRFLYTKLIKNCQIRALNEEFIRFWKWRGQCNDPLCGFGYLSVSHELTSILSSFLPPFDKGRKFGAYNGHLHSSRPTKLRREFHAHSKWQKVGSESSEFAFGRSLGAQKGMHTLTMIGRKWTKERRLVSFNNKCGKATLAKLSFSGILTPFLRRFIQVSSYLYRVKIRVW